MEPNHSFKFLCPLCGNKIEATVGWSGIEIQCPHCTSAIIVPQVPAIQKESEDSKRVKCRKCSNTILPTTAASNNGCCMRCKKGAPLARGLEQVAGWFFLVSAVVVVGLIGVSLYREHVAKEAFDKSMSQIVTVQATENLQIDRSPPLKFVIVDKGKSILDSIHFRIKKKFRASNLEEVHYVVLLDWESDSAGQYSGGARGRAMIHTCTVEIIDFNTKEIVARRFFRGGNPPEKSRGGRERWGSEPLGEIERYIYQGNW